VGEHILLGRLGNDLVVARNACVGNDNIESAHNALDFLDSGAVVGLAGGRELDNIELALVLHRKIGEGGGLCGITSTGKDDDALTTHEQ
jgi:hypothetical protein